jgi:hypothetical protein
MKVSELIVYLQTLPQEAEVFCLEEKQGSWESWCDWKNLTIDDISLTDLRGNKFIKENDPSFNRIFLEIGLK